MNAAEEESKLESEREEAEKAGAREQKEHIDVEELSAPRVITIPEAIVIDEEKESPPSSPTTTAAVRREVIAIDTDDSTNTTEEEMEEAMKDADEVVEVVGVKKPKKRVRFHEPVIESIRHIESEEADEEDEQKQRLPITHNMDKSLEEVMGAQAVEGGVETGERMNGDHWKERMTGAMLDVMVKTGLFPPKAVQQYNDLCDTAEQSDDVRSKWHNFNHYLYYRLFRCPVPSCDRLMVHSVLADGSERFSCSHTDDHVDSAVTGLNGPCYVYMDMEGRVMYESVNTPTPPSSTADKSAASDASDRAKRKRSIPRKAVQYVTTDRPSILSQLLTSRAAYAAEVSEIAPPVVTPVLASQMDESKVDNVLLSLLSVLRALHLLFYAHYAIAPPSSSSSAASSTSSVPPSSDSSSSSFSFTPSTSPSVDFSLPLPTENTLPSLLSSLKSSVLHGCHILFSGAFPSAQSAADTDIGKLAIAFGAVVYDMMDASGRGLLSSNTADHRITHIVAARDGSDKIKAGMRLRDRRPHVVHLSWLYASAAHFQRADERLFPLSLAAQADADEKAGVGGKENARGYVSPALVQHTQTVVTPLQLLRGMQKYRPSLAVLTAMRAALDEETNQGWSSKAVEEKKESSSTTSASSGSDNSSSVTEGRVRRKRKALTGGNSSGQTAAAATQVIAAAESDASALGRVGDSRTTAAETTAAQTSGADDSDMDRSEAEADQRSSEERLMSTSVC